MTQFGSLNLQYANKILPTLNNVPKSKYEYTRLSQKLNVLNNQAHYLKDNLRRILNEKFAEPEVYMLSQLLELKDEFNANQTEVVRYIQTAQLQQSFPTKATSVKKTSIDFISNDQNQTSFFSTRVLNEEIAKLEELIADMTNKQKKVQQDLSEFRNLSKQAKVDDEMKTLSKGWIPQFIHNSYPSRSAPSFVKLTNERKRLADIKKQYDLLAVQLIPEFARHLDIAKLGFTDKERKLFRRKFKFPNAATLTDMAVEMAEKWDEKRLQEKREQEEKEIEKNQEEEQDEENDQKTFETEPPNL